MARRRAQGRWQGSCVSTQSNQGALLKGFADCRRKSGRACATSAGNAAASGPEEKPVGTNPKSWARALSYLQTLSPLCSCFYCAVVDVSPLQTNDLNFGCCHLGSFTPQVLPLAEPPPHTELPFTAGREEWGAPAPPSHDSAEQTLPSLPGEIHGNRDPVALPEVLLG